MMQPSVTEHTEVPTRAMSEQPLVSVVTPVYNGEAYLRECIESVLAQTYSNWVYTIANNCSKDRTLEIAEEYAMKDARIRVYSNETLLPIIENHNKAYHLASLNSKYVKQVSADDWLFPECITRMVDLAEAQPSIGIVGSYQLSGGAGKWYLRTDGLSYYKQVVSGREICRLHLLGTLSILGNPTSNLYRADLVRSTDAFFPNETTEADVSACLKHLQSSDFGFVHQVLSHERLHKASATTTAWSLNAYLPARLSDCVTYGPVYLTPTELENRAQELLEEYYRFLALCAFQFRDKAFWDYHKRRLSEIGYPLDWRKLSKAVSVKSIDLALNPKHSIELLLKRKNDRQS
jgi:glycosyltransferase involved in cell wall biosynthesis